MDQTGWSTALESLSLAETASVLAGGMCRGCVCQLTLNPGTLVFLCAVRVCADNNEINVVNTLSPNTAVYAACEA
jgi:hypothetical protein